MKMSFFSVITLALTTVFLIEDCNYTNSKLSYGKWTNKALSRPIYLIIENDSSYVLSVVGEKFQFTGTYKINKGKVDLVDTYCGTKLPGVYEIKVKNDKMVFRLVSDEYCDRKKFLPGEWVRATEDQNSAQIDTNYSIDSSISQ